jgi:CRP-like cAMP-binding protein
MQAVLDHCEGGERRSLSAGDILIREGGVSGRLYVLIAGRLEILKGDTVVADVCEPGAVIGEMSVLLDQPHSATVRAAEASDIYEFADGAEFLRSHPLIATEIARQLAHRLSAATSYLADIKRQYADHGSHLSMVGDVLECMINSAPKRAAPGSDRLPDPRM